MIWKACYDACLLQRDSYFIIRFPLLPLHSTQHRKCNNIHGTEELEENLLLNPSSPPFETFKHGIIIIIMFVAPGEQRKSFGEEKVSISPLRSQSLYIPNSNGSSRRKERKQTRVVSVYIFSIASGILWRDYILENNIEKLMITE
jgi:hypothetical protein